MTSADWPVSQAHDTQKLDAARHQVHSLVQWLARIERSYGSQDETATPTLVWNDARSAIATSPLGRDLVLEMRLPDLVLQFRESGEAVSHPLHVEEHSPAHVEAWLLIELLHRGMDRDRFSKTLPYDVTGLMSGDAVEFSPEELEEELRLLAAWFSRAASAIGLSGGQSMVPKQQQPVRVRPDDLSLEGRPSKERIVGFKAGRDELAEPYFYHRREQPGGAAGPPEAVLPISQVPASGAAERVMQFFDGT